MIDLPTKGVDRAINKHNSNIDVVCDWIEASISFYCEELSIAEVVDALMNHELYEDQEFARAFVSNCWDMLAVRTKAYHEESTFIVKQARLERIADWNDKTGHAFCLLLSLAPNYDWWKESSSNVQGLLFEELSNKSIQSILNFNTYPTGWSYNSAKSYRVLADEICTLLYSGGGDIKKWDGANKKEYGLDILVYYDFKDGRTGAPYYMFQCASGENWRTKLNTPDLNIWREILNPSVLPCRGFTIPFCLSLADFECSSTKVGGIMLDRQRILRASKAKPAWLDAELKQKLYDWCNPRVEWLINGRMP